jgi:hypothetical protein
MVPSYEITTRQRSACLQGCVNTGAGGVLLTKLHGSIIQFELAHDFPATELSRLRTIGPQPSRAAALGIDLRNDYANRRSGGAC